MGMIEPAAPVVVCAAVDEGVARLLSDLLVDEGVVTALVSASSGRLLAEVDGALAALKPAAAIITIGYPHAEQWPAFLTLRRARPDCRLLIATTDRDTFAAAERDAPEVAVLAMPFDVEALRAAVRSAVGARAGGRPPRPSDAESR